MTLEHLIKLHCSNPRERFRLGKGKIAVGEKADFTVVNDGKIDIITQLKGFYGEEIF